jgi:hypothetical protein
MDWSTWIARHGALGGGLLACLIAALAWYADHRRSRRRDLDRVGFVPWTSLFFWATMAALLLLGWAARTWLAG